MSNAGPFCERELVAAFRAASLSAPPGLFDSLDAAYGERDRHYHDRSHVAECLRQFRRVADLAECPADVELAIWFHDAVYDAREKDNEERSVQWAAQALRHAGAAAEPIDRVVELILATKTHEPASADAALMVDVDLGILGTSPETFERYDQAIALEYAWMEAEAYRVGRAAVLRSFLERTRIYRTDTFHNALDARARANLAAKVAELEAG